VLLLFVQVVVKIPQYLLHNMLLRLLAALQYPYDRSYHGDDDNDEDNDENGGNDSGNDGGNYSVDDVSEDTKKVCL
jgi:hypothetical protein